jgi:hypothetical protein
MPLRVVIISHSHAPPLVPAADVKYNLRKLPNPPKAIRDRYDGRAKRLREHLRDGVEFQKLLTRAHGEIDAAGQDVVNSRYQISDSRGLLDAQASVPPQLLHRQHFATSADEPGAEFIDSQAECRTIDGSPDHTPVTATGDIAMPLLRVSCFCEMGRHRSVAFAEDLAASVWPDDWIVEVEHRDVNRERTLNSRGRKQKHFRHSSAFSLSNEDSA